MTTSGNRLKYLYPADIVVALFLLFLSLIMLVHNSSIPNWYLFLLLNISLIGALVFLVSKYESGLIAFGAEEKDYKSILKALRYWYGIAWILISFKEVYYIVYVLKPEDWDTLFIKMDFSLFKVNPTQWAARFQNPYLTEFMQLIYTYYYPMIIVFGLELYLWHRYKEFKYAIFVLFTGFFASYALYLIFPANGPRFHLHDFFAINKELPGIFLTEPIRNFLNFGESIPAGVTNPQDYVQRDAMPSLHFLDAFLIMYLSFRFKSKSFYFYLPYLLLMVIATIYLRYHYAVDILGGFLLGILIIAGCEIYYRRKFIST